MGEWGILNIKHGSFKCGQRVMTCFIYGFDDEIDRSMSLLLGSIDELPLIHSRADGIGRIIAFDSWEDIIYESNLSWTTAK